MYTDTETQTKYLKVDHFCSGEQQAVICLEMKEMLHSDPSPAVICPHCS